MAETPSDYNYFEQTLNKLNDNMKGKIKYHDFTKLDKYNFLEIFVNHPQTLVHIHNSIFDLPKAK